MEAYGLLMLEMKHNHIKIPQIWEEYLLHMSEFMCDCCGEYGETVVFGDNDEGKILDLSGEHFDHYRYVLDLMGNVLPKRYSKMENIHENLCWILKEDSQNSVLQKNCYYSPEVKCYKEGGYTLWRSKNNKVLIGIDHADLGFGSLAAHGHADALSFQMFIEGIPVFVDPGTYNYHVPKKTRDEFRATKNHNTVCVNDQNQAEILGPFLWGKRYECKEAEVQENEEGVYFEAAIQSNGNTHKRKMRISDTDIIKIEICDDLELSKDTKKVDQIFMLGTECRWMEDACINIGNHMLNIKSTAQIEKETTCCATGYNDISNTTKFKCSVSQITDSKVTIVTTIVID